MLQQRDIILIRYCHACLLEPKSVTSTSDERSKYILWESVLRIWCQRLTIDSLYIDFISRSPSNGLYTSHPASQQWCQFKSGQSSMEGKVLCVEVDMCPSIDRWFRQKQKIQRRGLSPIPRSPAMRPEAAITAATSSNFCIVLLLEFWPGQNYHLLRCKYGMQLTRKVVVCSIFCEIIKILSETKIVASFRWLQFSDGILWGLHHQHVCQIWNYNLTKFAFAELETKSK